MIVFKEVATRSGYITGQLLQEASGKWSWSSLDANFGPPSGEVYDTLDDARQAMADLDLVVRSTPF